MEQPFKKKYNDFVWIYGKAEKEEEREKGIEPFFLGDKNRAAGTWVGTRRKRRGVHLSRIRKFFKFFPHVGEFGKVKAGAFFNIALPPLSIAK